MLALRRLSARFRNMVIPGTSITIKVGAPTADGQVPFATSNAAGEVALANGLIEIDRARSS